MLLFPIFELLGGHPPGVLLYYCCLFPPRKFALVLMLANLIQPVKSGFFFAVFSERPVNPYFLRRWPHRLLLSLFWCFLDANESLNDLTTPE